MTAILIISIIILIISLPFLVISIQKYICNKKGHNQIVKEFLIETRGKKWRDVTSIYKCKIDTCSRCNKTLSEPYDLEYKKGYSSVSMPNEIWDELDEVGYLIKKQLS